MLSFLSKFWPDAKSRKRNLSASGLGLLCLWSGFAAAAGAVDQPVRHELRIQIDPAAGQLAVIDRIHLPAGSAAPLEFLLADTLEVTAEGATLQALEGVGAGRFRGYRLQVPALPAEVVLRYRGTVAAGTADPEHGMPTAVLGPEGVILNRASGWYPQFGNRPVSFRMAVELPPGWNAVSQGQRGTDGAAVLWETAAPQDDIYLLAGPYRRYAAAHGGRELEVYLLADDPELAGRYLQVLAQYLDFYSALLGDYPYPKFAVVENRWETGYGMPSFTLLGSRVLRLPFILHSSLPHEVLHNWWGNGVYVEPVAGNWSEGLTAYLADHLIKEAQGQGAEYRRQALERYANFAAEGRDFAVREFRSRHSDASQAVGYGKTMMLFHMLRRELGDTAFRQALRDFWHEFRFRAASFDDLRGSVERTVGRPVEALSAAWLDQAGAPALVLEQVQAAPLAAGGYRLNLTARQRQDGPAYALRVPVVVQFADGVPAQRTELVFADREAQLQLQLPARPLRVDLDPGFDLFRLLDPTERPPTLGRLFGAAEQYLVVPTAVGAEERAAWQQLARAWAQRYGNVRILDDAELERLPPQAAVWLLGWDNLWLARVADRLQGKGQALLAAGIQVEGAVYDAPDHAVVLLDPDNGRAPLGFIGTAGLAQIQGLARKLPHYGSAGRLVFAAAGLANLRRDALPVSRSPLSRVLDGHDPGPPPAVDAPLAGLAGVVLRFD